MREQQRQQREAFATQKEQARLAKTQQREAATAQKEQVREAQRQRNATLERTYRTEDRPFYSDSYGDLQPLHADADWPAVKKVKDDEVAEKARVETMRAQISAVDAEMGDPARKTLTQEQRNALTKELTTVSRDAVNSTLIPRLAPASQQTDKAGWYDVVNNNPTPEATQATQRMQSLTDRMLKSEEGKTPVDLDDTDLAELDTANPEGAGRIRTLRQQLTADDDNRTWQQERATRKFDLDLRLRNPQEWEKRQRDGIMAMADPEALSAEAQRRGADFQSRTTDLQARHQSLVQEQDALGHEAAALTAENETAIASGLAPHEITTLIGEDGSLQTWQAGLAARLQELSGRAQALQAQQSPALRALQAEATALETDRTLAQEASQQAQTRAKDRISQQRQRLRMNPSLAPAADELDRMDADLDSRAGVIMEMYPDGGPERDAALKALRDENAAGINGVNQKLQAKYEAGAKFYSTGEGSDLTEPEKGYWKSYFTKADFTQGNTEDPTRVLPDGSLRLNPSLWTDTAKATSAIEQSSATPEAKKSALAGLPDMEKAAFKALLPAMVSVPGFKEFAKQHRSDILVPGEWNMATFDQADIDARLADADYKDPASLIKAFREGPGKSWWRNQAGQALYGALSGTAALVQQGAGIWSAATGSPEAQRYASDAMALQQQIGGASEAMQGGQWTQKIAAGAVSVLPSLVGGYAIGPIARLAGAGRLAALTRAGISEEQALATATKLATRVGLSGAAGAAGLQSFGSTFSEAMESYTAQGMAEPEARGKALLAATASGLTTLGITYGFGATGVESFLKEGKALMKGVGFGAAVGRGVKGALSEAPEEALDQFLQGLIQQASFNPNKTFRQIVSETLEAGLLGGILGGGMEAVVGGGGTGEKGEGTRESITRFTPEALASAEAQIANYTGANFTPEKIAATQKGARAMIAVAQGKIDTLTDDQLAMLDLRRNAKGELENVLPTGRAPRVKVENGNPIITQPTLDRLETNFPAVHALIGMNESQARQHFKAPPMLPPPLPDETSSNLAQASTPTNSPSPAPAVDTTSGISRGTSPQAGASPTANSGEVSEQDAEDAVPASPAGTASATYPPRNGGFSR